jgi:hypothetical protein
MILLYHLIQDALQAERDAKTEAFNRKRAEAQSKAWAGVCKRRQKEAQKVTDLWRECSERNRVAEEAYRERLRALYGAREVVTV